MSFYFVADQHRLEFIQNQSVDKLIELYDQYCYLSEQEKEEIRQTQDLSVFLLIEYRVCKEKGLNCVPLMLGLLERGAKASFENSRALREAVTDDNLEVVKLLVQWGADPLDYDRSKRNTLSRQQVDMLYRPKIEVDLGFKIELPEGCHESSCWTAGRLGHIEVAQFLLECGCPLSHIKFGACFHDQRRVLVPRLDAFYEKLTLEQDIFVGLEKKEKMKRL